MPSRLRASASAAAVCSSGKRCVIRRSVAIAPEAMSASAARVSRGPAEYVAWISSSLKNSSLTSNAARWPGLPGANHWMTPPLSAAASARSHAAGAPVASMTTSAAARPCRRARGAAGARGARCHFVRRHGAGAERGGQRAPRGERLGHGHLRAARERGLRDQQPHLPAADHEQPRLRAHPRAVEPAHDAGQRLDQRRGLVADVVGQHQQIERGVQRRHQDELREAAGLDPRGLELGAQRLAPAGAVVAVAARHVVVHEHPRARLGQPGARLHHHARGLVAEHGGRLLRRVPVHEVAAADAAGAHRHQHLAWARTRDGPLLDPDLAAGEVDRGPQRTPAIAGPYGARSTPASVIRPVMSSAGVTSKAGFQTAVVTSRPATARTSAPSRCSISISAPVGRRGVQGRARPGDVERDAVMAGGDRQRVGADLVRDVAVGRHPVAADDHRVDPARPAAPAPRRPGARSPGCRRRRAPTPSAARPAAAAASRRRRPRPARPPRPWRRSVRARCPCPRWPGGPRCRP